MLKNLLKEILIEEISGGEKGAKEINGNNELAGKQVIVRCRDAGVHYGTYISHKDREVVLDKSRRMWLNSD